MDLYKLLKSAFRAASLPVIGLWTQAANAAGVEPSGASHGFRGVSFLDTYSTGNPVENDAGGQGLDWGVGLDQSVFSTTGDSKWLRGVAEGVSESVTSLIVEGELLESGISVGTVNLDRTLFNYGGSAEATRTILSAIDRFAEDFSAIIPTQAAVPLVLLVIVGVIAMRRRHG